MSGFRVPEEMLFEKETGQNDATHIPAKKPAMSILAEKEGKMSLRKSKKRVNLLMSVIF